MTLKHDLKAVVRQVVKSVSSTKLSDVMNAVRKELDSNHTLLSVQLPYQLYDEFLERTVRQALQVPRRAVQGLPKSALAVSWQVAHKNSKPLGDMTKPDLEEAAAYHSVESERERVKAEIMAVLATRVPDGTVSDNVSEDQVVNIINAVAGETVYAKRLLGRPGEVSSPGPEA